MTKLERKIIKLLREEYPEWRLLPKKSKGGKGHYIVTNGHHRAYVACTCRSGNQTAIRNLILRIKRFERGQYQ